MSDYTLGVKLPDIPLGHDGREPRCEVCGVEHLIFGPEVWKKFKALGFTREEYDEIAADAKKMHKPEGGHPPSQTAGAIRGRRFRKRRKDEKTNPVPGWSAK